MKNQNKKSRSDGLGKSCDPPFFMICLPGILKKYFR